MTPDEARFFEGLFSLSKAISTGEARGRRKVVADVFYLLFLSWPRHLSLPRLISHPNMRPKFYEFGAHSLGNALSSHKPPTPFVRHHLLFLHLHLLSVSLSNGYPSSAIHRVWDFYLSMVYK